MALPDGRKSFKIGLTILIQYRRVTDSQPPSQPRRRSNYARSKKYRSVCLDKVSVA